MGRARREQANFPGHMPVTAGRKRPPLSTRPLIWWLVEWRTKFSMAKVGCHRQTESTAAASNVISSLLTSESRPTQDAGGRDRQGRDEGATVSVSVSHNAASYCLCRSALSLTLVRSSARLAASFGPAPATEPVRIERRARASCWCGRTPVKNGPRARSHSHVNAGCRGGA